MPVRGYRKGVSDDKAPLSCAVRTHLSPADMSAMQHDANLRSLTVSRLMRQLIKSHLGNHRPRLPHPTGEQRALIRELARIGNNLNQLSKQANTGYVSVDANELHNAMMELTTILKRV